MRFGSVCSGIEAATEAWYPLGWDPVFMSEIEPFPRAVLEYHHPDVPLHGDFTTIEGNTYGSIDLLVGGTPCQSFSIAGLRKGLDDDRGNLALEYLRLAHRARPIWLVWENVAGVLSSSGGRDFGAFLGGLVELGYGFAYRVLDAIHCGTPMRRRRVYVVGYYGSWQCATAVLFDRAAVADLRKTIAGIPAIDASGLAKKQTMPERERGRCWTVHDGQGHRFLTPREIERAMGFPDNHTRIPWRGKDPEACPDGPRYKALGNSMAVPVMRWIGERINRFNTDYVRTGIYK